MIIFMYIVCGTVNCFKSRLPFNLTRNKIPQPKPMQADRMCCN